MYMCIFLLFRVWQSYIDIFLYCDIGVVQNLCGKTKCMFTNKLIVTVCDNASCGSCFKTYLLSYM